MDDIAMIAKLDNDTTIYVSPVHDHTYDEHVDQDNLGGSRGYFITRERGGRFDLLAKAVDLDAARELFGLLVSGRKAA